MISWRCGILLFHSCVCEWVRVTVTGALSLLQTPSRTPPLWPLWHSSSASWSAWAIIELGGLRCGASGTFPGLRDGCLLRRKKGKKEKKTRIRIQSVVTPTPSSTGKKDCREKVKEMKKGDGGGDEWHWVSLRAAVKLQWRNKLMEFRCLCVEWQQLHSAPDVGPHSTAPPLHSEAADYAQKEHTRTARRVGVVCSCIISG